MEKKALEFRTLQAGEIDCRIATATEKGVSLLLYKDARVDQNLLDETVGPMNWQRSHSRDNANCIVSIWDEEKKQWISKEDTGTESYTEKEKGLASDSFKRACFNWGIGRELYTAPFIWIPAGNCRIQEKADRNGKKWACNDRFSVKEIGYDDARNICSLVICNDSQKGRIVFNLAHPEKTDKPLPASAPQRGEPEKLKEEPKVGKAHIQTLYNECGRTGLHWKQIAGTYGVQELKDLTISQFRDAMEKFKRYPDKPDPSMQTEPPEKMDAVPWN